MYELPYGNTQQLNLDWFIKRWQEFYAQWQETEAGIDHALDAEIQRVEDAMSDLYAARDAAAASATAAAASAASAGNSATTAGNAATAAAASATLANNKATAAGLSEAAAANSANSASNSAGAAATSASQANASAQSATASAQSAAASETNAAGSAQSAAASAAAAAASASDAANSAQEAQDVLDSIPEDYTDLSNDVADLQADLAELQDDSVPMKNLIDFSKCTMGYELQNTIGQLRAAPNWYVTDWIEVKPNTAYALSGLSSKFKAEVNAEKTEYTGIQGAFDTYFITGSNTKYVRFNSLIAGYSTPQLEKGTVITPYEPFTLIPSAFPIIAKTLLNMVADEALNVNDFRIVNNTLYRITSPVASGATLTPNTNCTATTVSEVLKTLLT